METVSSQYGNLQQEQNLQKFSKSYKTRNYEIVDYGTKVCKRLHICADFIHTKQANLLFAPRISDNLTSSFDICVCKLDMEKSCTIHGLLKLDSIWRRGPPCLYVLFTSARPVPPTCSAPRPYLILSGSR